MIVEGIASGIALKTVGKPIDDLYSSASSGIKKKLKRYTSEKKIDSLYKTISKVHKVKTIWQVEKEVSLKEFYYPPRLSFEHEELKVSKMADIKYSGPVVVQGLVGQGKSIFLRYMSYQELRLGLSIPIFYELRRLQYSESLIDGLIKNLGSVGLSVDSELFEYFAASGKFSLFLDGFDEIRSGQIDRVIEDLEYLISRFPALRVVVTSRPDSGIQNSAFFRIYRLCALDSSDLPPFLKKLARDDAQVNEIVSAIETSSSEIRSLLQTPLMVTLLFITYKAEQSIPEQFSEFYDSLFNVLVERHDKTKPGYIRERKVNVNNRKLQKVFEAFCYLASKSDLVEIEYSKMHDLAEAASKAIQVECDSEDFIYDIVKVSNLVLEESGKYYFIHKSVREYYAASFIKSRPDDQALKFYTQFENNNSWIHYQWRQELKFLRQIDKYRHLKYYYVPSMFELYSWLKKGSKSWSTLPDEKFESIVKETRLGIGISSASRMNTFADFEEAISSGHDMRPSWIQTSQWFVRWESLNDAYSNFDILDKLCEHVFGPSSAFIGVFPPAIHILTREDFDRRAYFSVKGPDGDPCFEISLLELLEEEGVVELAKKALNRILRTQFELLKDDIRFLENEEANINIL